MESLEALYEKLEGYKDFDADPENTEHFLDTVDEIVLSNDPSSIPVLLSYFDDESEYSWVFEIIQNNIFFLIKNSGEKFFFNSLEKLLCKAPKSAEDIVSILFNDLHYLETFRQNMHLASKETLLKLFDIMEEESPHHKDLIQELRSELDKA